MSLVTAVVMRFHRPSKRLRFTSVNTCRLLPPHTFTASKGLTPDILHTHPVLLNMRGVKKTVRRISSVCQHRSAARGEYQGTAPQKMVAAAVLYCLFYKNSDWLTKNFDSWCRFWHLQSILNFKYSDLKKKVLIL